MIEKHPTEPVYSIHMNRSSYIVGVAEGRVPVLYHFGGPIPSPASPLLAGKPPLRAFEVADLSAGNGDSDDGSSRAASSSSLPVEYGLFGGADFSAPSLILRDRDGAPRSTLELVDSRVEHGLPGLETLPSVGIDAEAAAGERQSAGAHRAGTAETLRFEFQVAGTELYLFLSYAVLPEIDVVLRHVRLENRSGEASATYTVERLMSATLPFEAETGFSAWELITLDGAHARERYPHRTPLRPGTTAVGSSRGSSSHRHNPWAALVHRDTGEHRGEAFGVGLLYSGDFLIESEMDEEGRIRLNAGLHPDTTRFTLGPGESIESPQAALAYSAEGLNGLSRSFHALVTDYLTPTAWRRRPRPVLLNTWEAVYFDVSEAEILEIARSAAGLGVELIVLDDGWFGKRHDDTTSLGDWDLDREKLPNGLKPVAEAVRNMGMQFGLWVEPEMISAESELYRANPDWCLHVEGEERLESRNQLVLDLSRADVCDWIVERLGKILSEVPIDYIKWDMNRYLSNVGSATAPAKRQAEVPYRYMEGLYRVLEELTARFPEVLFEGCSGGGGRFDLGMMCYFPQYWTSDNTDAVSRLPIQYGTSFVYPQAAIGAHVTSVPNHQVGRSASLGFRSMVAMMGNYGFELDPRQLSDDEARIIRAEIEWYRRHRELLQFGRFYRLQNPLESYSRETSWIIVSPERNEAVAFWFQPFAEANRRGFLWRLTGLDPERYYEGRYMLATDVSSGDRTEHEIGVYSGAELMSRGLPLPPMEEDYAAVRLHLVTSAGPR